MYGLTINIDVLIENHIDIDNDIDTNISHHLQFKMNNKKMSTIIWPFAIAKVRPIRPMVVAHW